MVGKVSVKKLTLSLSLSETFLIVLGQRKLVWQETLYSVMSRSWSERSFYLGPGKGRDGNSEKR